MVNQNDAAYIELVKKVLYRGKPKTDRTGTGTVSYPGILVEYDLSNQKVPLLTTKHVSWITAWKELHWMLSGDTNVSNLEKKGVKIWSKPEWIKEDGTIGPGYGKQFRKIETIKEVYFDSVDQMIEDEYNAENYYSDDQKNKTLTPQDSFGITYEKIDQKLDMNKGKIVVYYKKTVDQLLIILNNLRKNPESRRHVIDLWNPAEVDEMTLPPCHFSHTFVVDDKDLHLHLKIRSNDIFLGHPFNIAQYSIYAHLVAKLSGLEAKTLKVFIDDAHIYNDHINQISEQLNHEPKLCQPIIQFTPEADSITYLLDFKVGHHFKILDYEHHPKIEAPVSV